MESTTVKVSKQTARKLSSLQGRLMSKSTHETVDMLVREYRLELIKHSFGTDRGKIKPFSERDRDQDGH